MTEAATSEETLEASEEVEEAPAAGEVSRASTMVEAEAVEATEAGADPGEDTRKDTAAWPTRETGWVTEEDTPRP